MAGAGMPPDDGLLPQLWSLDPADDMDFLALECAGRAAIVQAAPAALRSPARGPAAGPAHRLVHERVSSGATVDPAQPGALPPDGWLVQADRCLGTALAYSGLLV
jgi:hypothetical protein